MSPWERDGNFPNIEELERLLLQLGISKKEFQMAFASWLHYYRHQLTDEESKPYLRLENLGYGRLKKSREALLVSTNRAATLTRMSKHAYLHHEKNEKRGAITLARLAKIADSLELELIYNLRPKKKLSFAWVIWESIYKRAVERLPFDKVPRHRRYMVLRGLARRILRDPRFRREKAWNKRLFVNDGHDENWLSWHDINPPY